MKKDVAAYIQGTLKELEYLKLSGVNFEQLEEIGYKNILRLARYFSDCFDPNDLHSEIKSAEKQLKKIGNDNVLKMSELGSKIANLRMILGNLKLGQSNLRQLYEREKITLEMYFLYCQQSVMQMIFLKVQT